MRWTAEAGAELIAAAEWYQSKQGGLGAELIEEVDSVVRAIGEAPAAFPRWGRRRALRKAVVGERFPYVVFFGELGR